MLKNIFLVLLIFAFSKADKLEDIKSSGVLHAGVKYDFKPFGFKDEYNQLVGFDIDLVNYIASKLDVKAKFTQVTTSNRIDKLLDDEIDIIAASMTHKISRDKKIDFTISYFYDGQSFLVRSTSKLKRKVSFSGKKVGAIVGSSSGENLRNIVPKARIKYFETYEDALFSLASGAIDAITADLVWCSTQAKDSEGKFKVTAGTISVEPYGMGVPKNESNFKDEINFILQESVKDGTYSKLYEKWFDEKPKKIPEVWPN